MKLENYFNHAKKYIKYGMLSFLLLSAGLFTGCPQSNNNKPAVHTETAVLIKEIKMQAGQEAVTVTENISNPVWTNGKVILAFFLADGIKAKHTSLFLTADGKSVNVKKSKDRFTAELKGETGKTVNLKMRCSNKGAEEKRSFSIEFRKPDAGTMSLNKFELLGKKENYDITESVMPPKNPQWRVWDKDNNTFRFAGETDTALSKILVNGSSEKARVNITDSKKFEFEYTFPKDILQPISVVLSAEGYKDFRFNFTFVFTNKPNVTVAVGKKDGSGNFIAQAVVDENMFFAGKPITVPVSDKTPVIVKVSTDTAQKNGDKLTRVTADGKELSITEDADGRFFAEYTVPPFAGEADEEQKLVLKIEAETRGAESAPREPAEFTFNFVYEKLINCTDFLIDDGNGFQNRSGSYRCRRSDIKIKMIFDTDIYSIQLTDDYLYSLSKPLSPPPEDKPRFTVSGKEVILEIKLPDTGMEHVEIPVTVKADERSDTLFNFRVRYSQKPDTLIIGFAPFEMGHVSGYEQPEADAEGNIIKPLTVYLKHSSTTLYALTANAWEYTSVKINGTECLNKPAFTDPLHIVKSVSNDIQPAPFPGGQPNVNAVFRFENLEQNKVYDLEIELSGKDEVGEALLPTKLYGGKFRIMYK